MAETTRLTERLNSGGAYAVWELMDAEEKELAARALWSEADAEVRTALEMSLAKEMKFRPKSLRKLPVEKLVSRMALMAKKLPETMLFQFLYHFHMKHRRQEMIDFLDGVGLPHNEGVLDLPDDAPGPEKEKVQDAARALIEKERHRALVYLSTLFVADSEFWSDLEELLDTLL